MDAKDLFIGIVPTMITIISTLGGWECIKYLINRKARKRIEHSEAEKKENEADHSEFEVLRDTMLFLQEQLKDKEIRFAEQTDLVRSLNAKNLELAGEVTSLKVERSLKLCEKKGCKGREPQSGY